MYLHCFTLSHDCNTHYLMGPRGAAQGDGFDSPTSPRRHSAYSASFRDDATIVGIHALQIMSLCGVYTYEYIHMYRVCIIFSYAHTHIYIYIHIMMQTMHMIMYLSYVYIQFIKYCLISTTKKNYLPFTQTHLSAWNQGMVLRQMGFAFTASAGNAEPKHDK